MILIQQEFGPLRNFTYILGDQEDGFGAVIDPPRDLTEVDKALERHRLKLVYVFNTHAHYDHIGGNNDLRARGAKLVAHTKAKTHPDIGVSDGQIIQLGSLPITIIETPGHCPDAICLKADNHLFTGDTLFIGECGRTDFPESDPRAMHHSLLTVLRGLPDELIVLPGHHYGTQPQRTLGEEKRDNYTLLPRTLDEFLTFMGAA